MTRWEDEDGRWGIFAIYEHGREVVIKVYVNAYIDFGGEDRDGSTPGAFTVASLPPRPGATVAMPVTGTR